MTFRLSARHAFPVLLAFVSLQAHAVGNLADVTVTDRDSGATLQVHSHRGEYWVAGKPGARYAVSIRNRLGERLLAVPSVDGVNVLSGETAGWDQTGYVFGPRGRYQITGWRKSNSEVAVFEFSDAADSYAGRTGRPAHVGVIGVALFREQPPEPQPQVTLEPRRHEPGSDLSSRLRDMPSPAAPPAPSAGLAERSAAGAATARAPAAEATATAKSAPSQAPMPSPRLGTAHGQRETSYITSTAFTRLQPAPNEIIRIRYDSRENLVAAGVIREPVGVAPLPQPFPLSVQTPYVADPPPRLY
ncbi:MAG: hypothetical protein JWQ72_3551 [Polaromonas sp.]|nr:hypothetical protein [Polaromonas sp.]